MEVSVIVPVYNAERTIVECLESLTNQTVSNEFYDIILIDDGSTDSSAKLINDFILNHTESRISYQKIINSGPAYARNVGIKKSNNDIVLLTDSDCKVEEDWIEFMYSSFKDDEIVAVKGRYKTEQPEEVAKLVQAEFETKYKVLENYEYIDFVDTYSAGYRRDAFLELGGFDESYPQASTEDIDLSFRFYQRGFKMKFNSSAVVYHIHPNSFRNIFWKKVKFAYWRMYTNFKLGKFGDTRTDTATKFQLITTPVMVLLMISFLLSGGIWSIMLLIVVVFIQSLLSLPLFKCYQAITNSNKVKSFILYNVYINVKSSGQIYGILKYLISPPKILKQTDE